ncbi:hypothetical protein BGX21_008653 [Mortierella sp. AD011]|nr:hypothetical protein BGX20_008708 [Mortierella sp. AD010]KAF9397639.1 hypothetical protein BGX21_008653 [Mortierella sp. AD011]
MNDIVAKVKFERKKLRDQIPKRKEEEVNEIIFRTVEDHVRRQFDPIDHRAISNLLKVYINGTGSECSRPLPRKSELKLKEALSSFIPVVDTASQDQETILSFMETVKQIDVERIEAL